MNHSLGLLKAPHPGDGVPRSLAIRARSSSRRRLRATRAAVLFLGLLLPARVGFAQRAEQGQPSGHPPAHAPGQTLPGGDRTGPIEDELPPEDSGPPPGAASDEEIDLAELGLDPNAPSFDDQLNVYGFASFLYRSRHPVEDHGPSDPSSKTFTVANLNLYLAKNLTENARTLIEIAFTFLPNGGRRTDDTVIDTTVTDPTNYDRATQWGSIEIERAYLEYDLTDFLTIRGGRWLTPYGIWNIDHGSPAINPNGRPYIVGEQFFPEHQTGLDLFGSFGHEAFKLSYHATVSNGRGGADAQQDQDDKFAFGGRLELEVPWGLRIGGSIYRGRYTGLAPALGALPDTYLETAYGGDVQLDRGPLHVQGEIIARDRRHPTAAASLATASDGRDFGYYAFAGYRLDRLWNVMPYTLFEEYRPADHTLGEVLRAGNVGFNFRPSSSLVFKVNATWSAISAGMGLLAETTVREFNTQACWVF